jgi:hypothetical protein
MGLTLTMLWNRNRRNRNIFALTSGTGTVQ